MFSPGLQAALAVVVLHAVAGTRCPPDALDHLRPGKCNVIVGPGKLPGFHSAVQCSILCLCDGATGRFAWSWETNNPSCPRLGSPVTSPQGLHRIDFLRHPKCGTLALQSRGGGQCPINCYRRKRLTVARFVHQKHLSGKQQDCFGLGLMTSIGAD